MKKSLIFFSLFLSVFLLLIFQSSFCWASSDVVVNYNNIIFTIDNSSNFLNDYSYCYVSQTTIDSSSQGRNVKLWFTTDPIYYSSGSGLFVVANGGSAKLADVRTFGASEFNLTSTDFTSSTAEILSNSGALYPIYASVDNSIFNDSDLTEFYNGNFPVVYDSSFISGFSITSFESAIGGLSTTLSADNVWLQFENTIPFLSIILLVILGFRILYMQLKKLKKMR